jgi:hypothetical protein
MIYFIRSEGFVKIGFATSRDNVATRFQSHQCGNPHAIALLGVMEGMRDAEIAMHNRFATDHHRGEWFRLSPQLASFIEGNCSPLIMDIGSEERAGVEAVAEAAVASAEIARFMHERVRREGRISSAALYAAFADHWSDARPELCVPSHAVFGRMVAESGFVRFKSDGGKSWYRASMVEAPDDQDTCAGFNVVS